MRRIDEVWMSRAQFARDAIQRIPSNVAADRQENNAILRVEFCNSGAARRRIALTEHLLQIAEQKRFDRLLHDGFPSQDEARTLSFGPCLRRPQDHVAVALAQPAHRAQAVDDRRVEPDEPLAVGVDLRLDPDRAQRQGGGDRPEGGLRDGDADHCERPLPRKGPRERVLMEKAAVISRGLKPGGFSGRPDLVLPALPCLALPCVVVARL
jgi:hypothetical protein